MAISAIVACTSAGIEGGVELVGRHVEVHQPAALVLGVDQPGGQLLDVRLGGGEPALQLRRPLGGAPAPPRVGGPRRLIDHPDELADPLQRRAQLRHLLEPGAAAAFCRVLGAPWRFCRSSRGPFVSSRAISLRMSSLWNGFLM